MAAKVSLWALEEPWQGSDAAADEDQRLLEEEPAGCVGARVSLWALEEPWQGSGAAADEGSTAGVPLRAAPRWMTVAGPWRCC